MRARRGRMDMLEPGTRIMGNATLRMSGRALDHRCSFSMDDAAIYLPDHAWGVPVSKRAIASKVNDKHWVCPNWLPPDNYYISQARLPDEGVHIDNALEPVARNEIRNARRDLIRALSLAYAKVPTDSVLLGQYIRMLADNGQLAQAIVVLDNCRAGASWCLALRGFTSAKLRQVFDAEDAFLSMLDSLSAEDACRIASIGVLLDEEDRRNYERLSCTQQDSLNRTIWWLADPLWSVPGNDRFVEHFVRRVTIAMRSALGRDERYNWMPQAGGDALVELVERYGWASYADYNPQYALRVLPDLKTIYSRPPGDSAERRIARALGGRRTTFEYSLGRVHVIPPMSMVNDPFSIANADWSMNAPGGEWDHTFNWWPVEHYTPFHPLTKLVDQQTAFLRRQDTTLLAFATNLARTDLARRLRDSVSGVLMTSTAPRAIRRVGEKRLGAQDRLTFLSPLPSGPSVVSVEVPSLADGERGARSRFGVRPPAPLSAMVAGEAAISDPVILVVPPNVTVLPTQADSAIALMNGSTTLAAGTSSVGVYWETYGIAAGDSVEITLTLQARQGGPAVTTSWREPQPGRAVRTLAGAVPIQMRSLILDVGAVPIGTYDLEISVRRPNGQMLRSTRELSVR